MKMLCWMLDERQFVCTQETAQRLCRAHNSTKEESEIHNTAFLRRIIPKIKTMHISYTTHLVFVAVSSFVVVNSVGVENSPSRRRELPKVGDRFLRKDQQKPKPAVEDADLQREFVQKDAGLEQDDKPVYYRTLSMQIVPPDEFNEWGAFEESQPTLVSLEAPRSEMEESMSIFEGFESVPAVPVQANGGGKSESPVEAPAAPLSTPVADVASGAEADKLPPPEFNDWGVSVEELLPVPMSSEAPKSVMEESMFEGSETVPVVPAEVSRRAHPYRLFSQSAKAGKSGGKSMKARKCTFFC